MSKKVVVTASAFLLGVAAGFLSAHVTRAKNSGSESFERRARDYCSAVNAAMEIDAHDLAKSDHSEQQRAAADRFMTSTTYHSEAEILMCSVTPPDLTRWQGCWLKYDYACLESVARAAAVSTKQPR